MALVLIKSPGSVDEQTFFLRPGINRLGSAQDSHIQLNSPGIRAHHLNIEARTEGLSVSSAAPDLHFSFRNHTCRQALLGPGDVIAVDTVTLFCQEDSQDARTELAVGGTGARVKAGVANLPMSTQAPRLGSVQISRFIEQKALDRSPFMIGRNNRCDLVLNHPLVSALHARITRRGSIVSIEDLHSSNGTYVSDVPVRTAQLEPGETILIMPYLLLFTGDRINVYTFEQESRLIGYQIDVLAGVKKILDHVTLKCASSELIGLIGPSGSGKTTLMKCLSGQMMPAAGRVQLNGLEMFSHFDVFKGNIGYVPQDDIIHPELTVQQTLLYAAKLRLPADMTELERKIRVKETLIELELEEQERQAVYRLSGGQRKRVNIAIELLTKPGVLFLDEPTSGLDPALDEKLMLLFKKLSQDGRITILTTHLLEHASMFSKIALMHSGRLIFYGPPDFATGFFDVPSVSALYARIKTRSAEEWQEKFQRTTEAQAEAAGIRDSVLPSRRQKTDAPVKPPESLSNLVRQGITYSQRYADIILRDRKNTGLLLLQAPLIAFFIYIATTNLSSRLFMMALAALWFGCNNSAREICKELPLYRRERMVNLRILPYLSSKFAILSALVFLQCFVLALLTPADFMNAYGPLLLCGLAGIGLGLLVSAIVDSPDKAIALVPILLIPQVLFSGIFGELHGAQRVVGDTMISKWSYNLLKKEFGLPSFALKDELEAQIDQSQEELESAQLRATDLRKNMDDVLAKMRDTLDPVELDTLRFDAERQMNELKSEQSKMEDARSQLQIAEKRLRANSRLFVWIDHPESTATDWMVLTLFVVLFFAGSAIRLKLRDRALKTL